MKIFNFVVEVPKLAGPGGSASGWKVLGIIQTVAEETARSQVSAKITKQGAVPGFCLFFQILKPKMIFYNNIQIKEILKYIIFWLNNRENAAFSLFEVL